MRRAIHLVVLLALCAACSGDLPATSSRCDDARALALIAQAVPDAASIPCFDELPFGFRATTFDVESDRAEIGLSHAVTGRDAAVMIVAPSCHLTEEERQPPPAEGQLTREETTTSTGGVTGTWVQGLGGACLTVRLAMDHPDGRRARDDLDGSWRLRSRDAVAAALRLDSDGVLDLRHPTADGQPGNDDRSSR